MRRLVICSRSTAQAHLMTVNVCSDLPGAEQLLVLLRSWAIISWSTGWSVRVGHGGGSLWKWGGMVNLQLGISKEMV